MAELGREPVGALPQISIVTLEATMALIERDKGKPVEKANLDMRDHNLFLERFIEIEAREGSFDSLAFRAGCYMTYYLLLRQAEADQEE